jgi:nitrite reductase/ring-hydroxylating ferredoxin subunit
MREFVPTLPLADLRADAVTPFRLGSLDLALYLVDGQPWCTEDVCSHDNWLISDGGWLDGDEVECTRHGARFNVRTGRVTAPPAAQSIRSYPVEVRDGLVYVQVEVRRPSRT